MLELEYITDENGQQKAFVIPTELWRKIVATENASLEDISEEVENYCLNKAMDEAVGPTGRRLRENILFTRPSSLVK